jgi:outer membrane protein
MKMNKLSSAILAATLTLTGATATYAHEAGDIIVRAGIANVDPKDATTNDIDEVSALGADSNIAADGDTQLGLNFVYMLSDNWGVEVLAATPFEHDIQVTLANTGTALDGTHDVGSTKHLPPTVSLQYYLFDKEDTFRPYVGAGINYTWFFDESDGANFDDLDLDDSFGLAFQAGVDVMLTDNFLLNASVYHIDIDTEATVKLDQSLPLGGEELNADVDIDPLVYMVSVGYKL